MRDLKHLQSNAAKLAQDLKEKYYLDLREKQLMLVQTEL